MGCNHCKARLKKGARRSTKRVFGAPECDGELDKAIEVDRRGRDRVESVQLSVGTEYYTVVEYCK